MGIEFRKYQVHYEMKLFEGGCRLIYSHSMQNSGTNTYITCVSMKKHTANNGLSEKFKLKFT